MNATRIRSGIAGLLAANALTLLVALWQQWPLVLLLWPYWIQSVLIGWFARKRLQARGEGSLANFFAMHYGIFHGAYLAFLLQETARIGGFDWLFIVAAGAGFWFAQQHAHAANVEADAHAQRGVGALMAMPYARILPMHLCAGLAFLAPAEHAASTLAVIGFSALKTGADVLMFVVERRWLQRGTP